MQNVSLKVLEKSLKFLFKKGYEPCLSHFPEWNAILMDVMPPHLLTLMDGMHSSLHHFNEGNAP